MAWLQRVSLLLGVLIAAAAATGPAKPALGSFGTAFVAPSLLVGRSSVSPANPSSKAGRLHLAGPLVAPRRASPSRGALTVVCGLKKMFTDFSDNIGEVFKGGTIALGADDAQLKKELGDEMYQKVVAMVDKGLERSRKEVEETKAGATERERKLQRQINEFSNKVRDLEFQLIMAASEVTELEETVSTMQADGAPAPAAVPLLVNSAGEDHPVFGRFLADFGYKRIYVADPAKLLAKTPVYKKQRTFRTERASAMARAKLRSGVSGWPGTLSIVEYPTAADADDGTVGSVLVDGQHRLGAFTLLARKVKGDGAKPISGMEEMLVEVYPSMDSSKAAEVFTEINKAEPCRLIDLPMAGASPETRAIIDEAAERMRRKFSGMFMPSVGCRSPHMNIDNLRDQLFQADVVGRENMKSADDLYSWLLERNDALASIPEGDWKPKQRTRAKTLPRALAKATAQIDKTSSAEQLDDEESG